MTSRHLRAIPDRVGGPSDFSEVLVPESKIRRPRQRSGTVARTALVDRFARSDHEIIMVLAPAGFGKTTVVSQWVDSCPGPIAWVTMSAADRDPVVLMWTILTAILGSGADLDTPRGVLTGDEPAFSRRVLPQFQQALGSVADPITVVLEDIHLMDSVAASVILVATVDSLPDGSRVVLVDRSRPDLPIDLWRGQGRLTEFGPEDLAFDNAEIRECLTEQWGRQPSRDELARVRSRSGGWPVAVDLESSALRRLDSVAETTPLVVNDYVRSEVLSGLDPELAAFLRRTSILTSQSGPLCDHVLEATGSAEKLSQVEAATLLVGRLEGAGGWYRTHPLLKESLAAELAAENPADVRQLHARAARWYADQHQSDEALLHAIESGEPDLIAEVGWSYGTDALLLGRASSVASWLDRIPRHDVETTPALSLLAAWTGVVRGDSVAARTWAEAAARSFGPAWVDHLDRSPHEPALALLVCLSGTLPHPEAASLAAAAAHALPVSDRTRPLAVLLQGWHQVLTGSVDEGVQTLHDSHALAVSLGIGTNAVEAPAFLGYVYASRGDLKRATAMAASARAAWEAHDLQDAAPATGLLHGLETFVHARNRPPGRTRLDLATTASIAEQISRMMPAPAALIDAFGARTWAVLGDRDEATQALERAKNIMRDLPPSPWLAEVVASADAELDLSSPLAGLTPAQRRVWEQLATDKTLDEIAQELHLSRNTVKAHARDIYRKLGVTSRRAATRLDRPSDHSGPATPGPTTRR